MKLSPGRFFLFYLLLSFSLLSITACNSWGYRGPLYEWTAADVVYYDINKKAVCFADSSKKIFFVSVLWGKNQYFEQKDISQNSNSFTIPDSILSKIINQKVVIQVIPQHMTVYSIPIKANQWHDKFVLGQPINDVSNYAEMKAENKKLSAEMNLN